MNKDYAPGDREDEMHGGQRVERGRVVLSFPDFELILNPLSALKLLLFQEPIKICLAGRMIHRTGHNGLFHFSQCRPLLACLPILQ